jgi:hypothetical protein
MNGEAVLSLLRLKVFVVQRQLIPFGIGSLGGVLSCRVVTSCCLDAPAEPGAQLQWKAGEDTIFCIQAK